MAKIRKTYEEKKEWVEGIDKQMAEGKCLGDILKALPTPVSPAAYYYIKGQLTKHREKPNADNNNGGQAQAPSPPPAPEPATAPAEAAEPADDEEEEAEGSGDGSRPRGAGLGFQKRVYGNTQITITVNGNDRSVLEDMARTYCISPEDAAQVLIHDAIRIILKGGDDI